MDAIGVTSRAVYPDARVWRPLMERMVSDITPSVNKIYVALNRLLAQHEVLPEINAALRARSTLRPADDADLLPAFKDLLAKAGMAGRVGADATRGSVAVIERNGYESHFEMTIANGGSEVLAIQTNSGKHRIFIVQKQ